MTQTNLDKWVRRFFGFEEDPFLETVRRESLFLLKEMEKALPLAGDYRKVRIPKKKGGYRIIFIPSPELKKMQRRILGYLQTIWPPCWMDGIYGLYQGSYVDHAILHSDSRWIFQFDIENAFPSVNMCQLRTVLLQPSFTLLSSILEKKTRERLVDLIIKLTTDENILPQGAPTSPFLFYLILTESELFGELCDLCAEK